MMINVEIEHSVELAKASRDKWGWMIYITNSSGQKTCRGIYTDPAKMLVELGHMMLGKKIGGEDYVPNLVITVIDDGAEKVSWSTQQAEDEKKAEKERAQALKEMQK